MLTACMVQGSESFWVVGNTIRHMIAATPIFLRVGVLRDLGGRRDRFGRVMG